MRYQIDPSVIMRVTNNQPTGREALSGFLTGSALGQEYADAQRKGRLADVARGAVVTDASGRPTVDYGALASGMIGAGAWREGIAAQEAGSQIADRELLTGMRRKVADLDMETKRYDLAGRLVQAARANPQAWTAIKPRLERLTGVTMPDQPNEDVFKGIEGMGMDTAERLTIARDAFTRQYQQSQLQHQQAVLTENQRQADLTLGIRREELGEQRAYHQQSMDVEQQKAASLSGYREARAKAAVKPPPVADTVVGRPYRDEQGKWVQMVADGKGGTRKVIAPATENQLVAGLLLPQPAAPAAAGSPPVAPAEADIVQTGKAANGRPLAKLRDGRIIYTDDGSPYTP